MQLYIFLLGDIQEEYRYSGSEGEEEDVGLAGEPRYGMHDLMYLFMFS